MYHIRREIMEIEGKMDRTEASPEDIKRITELQKEDDELWKQFEKHHYDQGYEEAFPSHEYIKRKKGNAKRSK